MISVVKYFRQNHFQGKMIFFQKYFSAFGVYRKIPTTKNEIRRQPLEFDNIRSLSQDFGKPYSGCTGRNPASTDRNQA
jgi:hypothetical protein